MLKQCQCACCLVLTAGTQIVLSFKRIVQFVDVGAIVEDIRSEYLHS